MLDVELPSAAAAPPIVCSFRACLASVTEIPLDDVPQPDTDLHSAIVQWRTWLAGRERGLVPIAHPSRFQWPGYWIAVLEEAPTADPASVLMFGSPPGVVLSPQDGALLGRAAADLHVAQGYVVASFDPAVLRAERVMPRRRGRVETIAIAHRAEAPMERVSTAQAIPGRGLEGDRYANHAGTFTPRSGRGSGYDLTLIEAEVLDELALTDGNRLAYTEARRNIVTRGINLDSLVGQRFTIGSVECVGRRRCEPCAHLERLTHPGVLRGLIHAGGLRADVLTAGTISQDAAVELL